MTTRKRFLVTVSAAMLAVGLFAPGAHAKVGNGNSDAAHICQQQGYEELEGDDGTTFSNPGECTGFAAAVVGGVAIAQSSDEVIACVAQTTGNVRIVTSADDCKPNENDMSWSRQGPAGLPGPQGERGPAGATNIVQRFGSPVVVASGRTAGARASCLL